MKFIQLTQKDGEPVWVNMEHVHLMVRFDDATVLRFVIGVGGGGGIETVAVKEVPFDILGKV